MYTIGENMAYVRTCTTVQNAVGCVETIEMAAPRQAQLGHAP